MDFAKNVSNHDTPHCSRRGRSRRKSPGRPKRDGRGDWGWYMTEYDHHECCEAHLDHQTRLGALSNCFLSAGKLVLVSGKRVLVWRVALEALFLLACPLFAVSQDSSFNSHDDFALSSIGSIKSSLSHTHTHKQFYLVLFSIWRKHSSYSIFNNKFAYYLEQLTPTCTL